MPRNKATTSSYSLTLPLEHEIWQFDYLNKLFRVCGNMCNNLIDDRKKALDQMLRTREWKNTIANIDSINEQLRVLRKTPENKRSEAQNKQIEDLVAVRTALNTKKNDIKYKWGFSLDGFEARMKHFRSHYSDLVNSAVAQKLAAEVWQKFQKYFSGKGKEIRFIPWTEFDTIEAKASNSGFIFRGNYIEINERKFGIVLPPKEKEEASPSAVYEFEVLRDRTKYCRILRKWYSNGWHYFVQLIQEGVAPLKVKPKTGALLHQPHTGRVGLDIGPQTLAVSSPNGVMLTVLADRVQDIQNELRRINRAMDRSRRAMNPDMFNEDGTIINIDKLPSKLVENGKRKWVNSNSYNRLASKRRALYRDQADMRIQCHHELANVLISYGDEFYIENMKFSALAKRAKKTEKSEKTGKYKRKKRFGKSIANKAPAKFVKILTYTVKKYGGTLTKINTY